MLMSQHSILQITRTAPSSPVEYQVVSEGHHYVDHYDHHYDDNDHHYDDNDHHHPDHLYDHQLRL